MLSAGPEAIAMHVLSSAWSWNPYLALQSIIATALVSCAAREWYLVNLLILLITPQLWVVIKVVLYVCS